MYNRVENMGKRIFTGPPPYWFSELDIKTLNLLLSLTEEWNLGWLLVEDIFGAVLDLGVESGEVSDLLIMSWRLLV